MEFTTVQPGLLERWTLWSEPARIQLDSRLFECFARFLSHSVSFDWCKSFTGNHAFLSQPITFPASFLTPQKAQNNDLFHSVLVFSCFILLSFFTLLPSFSIFKHHPSYQYFQSRREYIFFFYVLSFHKNPVIMSTRINQVKHKPAGTNRTQYPSTRDRVSGNRWPGRTCGFRLLKRSIVSPVKFLKHFGRKVAKALCLGRRSSPGVSSSGRSKPSVAPSDTHIAEAIEDCIDFINSSSLPRSNSVSANPS